ncbi:apolipoprotein D-like [Chrysoperla carnea]|uniref:apolipoprotein D-like n=1 Tax=Chrysoperla carnea TaxID=189513 RepID=UPI001D062D93|nr:apolipoprotein D-like [Chrysoperla carnea]
MYFKLIVILGVITPNIIAQVPNLGFCPGYIPMADFNMNRFLGKWYESERYFTFSEVGSRCVTTNYAKGPNGKIFVSNKITNRITGVKRIIDGEINEIAKGGEGRITVKYNTLPVSYDTSYVILDTDYDSFAVLWACSGIGPIHTQNAWVMTRERLPAGTVLQKAYGVLDKYKISRAFFVKTDQESCALTADDFGTPGFAPDEVDENDGAVKSQGLEKSAVSVPEHILKSSELEKIEAPQQIKELPQESTVLNTKPESQPEKLIEKIQSA